jgi:transposase
MSSIVKNKSGQFVYLYESISYRDENGNPRNKRVCVGKIDPATGEEIYNPKYLERTLGTDKQPKIGGNERLFSVNDIKASKNREYGVQYLLNRIAQTIGLTDVLKLALSKNWVQVLTLADFMVASGEPAMYCEDWLNRTDSLDAGELSSQKISELLLSITDTERMMFFEEWGKTRQEQEYFALDITSVSSYSELIGDVAWGYNRDGEKLPQINVCMLVGEKSGLPIFSVVYNGALKDVSTLKSTLAMLAGVDLKNIIVVMDKGFASKKNIDAMLADTDGLSFLVSLPFTMKFAKTQVESERKDINTLKNTITIGDDTLRGVTKSRSWNTSRKLFTHVYFNPVLASGRQNELFGYVTKLRDVALIDPLNTELSKDFDKYLVVRKSTAGTNGVTVSIREDAVENELALAGWMVAVSNFDSDAKKALSIYRAKDVVEKGFLRLKNCLDLARLRVHSDVAMQNKIFIGFIALILLAHIHKVMCEHELYKTLTMKKMFKSLETLRVQYVKGQKILYPLTAQQKDIFSAFSVDLPV